jgi:hypothetical protein
MKTWIFLPAFHCFQQLCCSSSFPKSQLDYKTISQWRGNVMSHTHWIPASAADISSQRSGRKWPHKAWICCWLTHPCHPDSTDIIACCPWNYHITRDNTASSTSIETYNKGWHEAHTVQVKSSKHNSIGTHKTCRSCYYYLRHSTWLLQWLLYSCCAIVFWRSQNQDGPVWVYRN